MLPGDVVVNKMKAWQGSVAVSAHRGIVSGDYLVCEVVGRVDRRFLHHLLRSRPLIDEYGQRSTGIRPSQWRIYWDDLADICVNLPSLEAQGAIAAYLDAETARIDALIDKKRRMVDLLRTRLVAARRYLLDSDSDAVGTVPLRRLIRCLDGRRVPLNQEERSTRQGPYPYWGAGAVVDHVDDYLFADELVLLGEDGSPFFDGSRDVAFFVDEPIWANNHIHVLRPNREVNGRWLSHMLNAVDYGAYITGSTRDKLTQDQMMEIRLPLLDRPSQAERAAALDYLERIVTELKDKLDRQVDLLVERRQALITAAVTGEVEVRGVAA